MSATGTDPGTVRRPNAGHGDGNNNAGGDEFQAFPVSLADLQDDDDKSSLESGEVSPTAFGEPDAMA